MENVKFAIPQWALDIAIEGLQELVQRREYDAAAFAKLDTPEARALAQERLEQAQDARRGYEFFIHL